MNSKQAPRRMVGLPRNYVFGGLLLLGFLAASGCGRLQDFWVSFRSGGDSQESAPVLTDVGAAPSNLQLLTPKERYKLNRAFLLEIYEQVYAKPLEDPAVFNNWMNILSQGASVEGLYRGLTLSSDYQALERGIANEAARTFFASDILRLDAESGKNYPNLSAMDAAIHKRVEKYSLFTLKRILGEKYLSVIEQKSADRNALVEFYVNSVARFNALEMDYGMAARNLKDQNSHRQWAERSSKGRIQWELLNRVHRALNGVGKIVIQPRKSRPTNQGGTPAASGGTPATAVGIDAKSTAEAAASKQ